MEILYTFFQMTVHLDQFLTTLTTEYGVWIYAILFAIVFCETGLVLFPLLPGDSLLFTAGVLCSLGEINPHLLAAILTSAAILGDWTNYWVGKNLGVKPFQRNHAFLFNETYLRRGEAFFEKYGAKAIVIGRFMPIVRTFVPFVAGISRMNYKRFITFNFIGAFLWVYTILFLAYWFGNIPIVTHHFSTVILGIVFISLLPPVIDILINKNRS